MTTINGKTVPPYYGSIENLPELIDALDHDWSAWPDGDYTAEEMGWWLHQFHNLCGERHFINDLDVAEASIHGPAVFRHLGPQQKKDLVAFFSRSISGYTDHPTEHLNAPLVSGAVQSAVTVEHKSNAMDDEEFQHWRDDAQSNLLATTLKGDPGFFSEKVFPYLDTLPQDSQQQILLDFAAIPSDVDSIQLWEELENVFREYDLPFSYEYNVAAKMLFRGCWGMCAKMASQKAAK